MNETTDNVVENASTITENTSTIPVPMKVKKPKGFAAMSPEKRKAISALGGKRAHELGVAHRYTSDEAKTAGQLGGNAPHLIRGRAKAPAE